ncbi:unnamed protein product [Strongylus vulgaris]|uniref:Uncharacterized protein n=1 Tax=Strongylus vulgaris TaxID=40348 RepID=A0A3P7J1V2_STRVU|nr:unnamed protein product [Strongylus vulgaris]
MDYAERFEAAKELERYDTIGQLMGLDPGVYVPANPDMIIEHEEEVYSIDEERFDEDGGADVDMDYGLEQEEQDGQEEEEERKNPFRDFLIDMVDTGKATNRWKIMRSYFNLYFKNIVEKPDILRMYFPNDSLTEEQEQEYVKFFVSLQNKLRRLQKFPNSIRRVPFKINIKCEMEVVESP